MPNRLFSLFFASAVVVFAQSGAPPSTPLTYFLGRGPSGATPKAVAAGPGGDIWVAGETYGNNFPVVNALQEEFSPGFCGRFGCTDMFLSHLRADGEGAVFSTYLGGAGGETLTDMTVDGEGNAYVTGSTSSESFPFTSPLPDPPSAYRPFVVKISPSGEIVYATALPLTLSPESIVVDQQGSAYVGGTSFGETEQIGGLGFEPGEADLLRSDDRGQSWEFRNRGLTGATFTGDGTDLVAAPMGDAVRLYLIGTVALYRSDNRGELWTRLPSPQGVEFSYFTDLAVDLINPDRLLTAYGCGLYGSSDAGETWEVLLPYESPSGCVLRVAVAPIQPGIVYAGGYGNQGPAGIFGWMKRSDDGGQNWTDLPLPQGGNLSSVGDLSVDPTDPRIVYATFVTDGGFSLFRSDDAGLNWHRIFENSVKAPVIDPAEPKTLFLVTQFYYPEGKLVYRSFDRGETWGPLVVPDPTGIDGPGWLLNLALGGDALYVTTNEGRVFVSADRGQSWAQAPGPPVLAYQVVIDPVQPGTIYALGNTHFEQGFLLKLSPDASRVEYLTLLGGSGEDRVQDIAIDDDGRIYATGITASPDFPVTSQLTLNRPGFDYDVFLAIVSPGGDELKFSAWLGGSGHEYTSHVALGTDRTVVLAGSTNSRDFPLENPVAAEPARMYSHWVAGVNPDESRLVFSGYLGPNDVYGPTVEVAADREGSIYLGGLATLSDENGFLTESNFLMRLDTAGNVVNVDPVTVVALAAESPGRIVTASVGASGILSRPWGPNETPAIVVSVRDYNAAEPDGPGLQAFVNAADQRGHPLTPGTVVSIYGTNLGPASPVLAEPVDGRYPSEAAGVRVLFGDRPAALLYVSESQINAVTPGDVGEHPLASIRVERDGAASNTLTLTTDTLSPAVFAMDSGLESFALAINADGTVNSPGNPATRGSIVSVFATGVGGFSPALADGQVAPVDPPFPAASGITGIGSPFHSAQVTYAGAAPGVVAGVAQINFVVPLEMTPDDSYFYIQTNEEKTSSAVRLHVGP